MSTNAVVLDMAAAAPYRFAYIEIDTPSLLLWHNNLLGAWFVLPHTQD